jgi:Sec-independent protein translocase protein TatA
MGIFNDSYDVAKSITRVKKMNDMKREKEQAQQEAQKNNNDQKPKGIFF